VQLKTEAQIEDKVKYRVRQANFLFHMAFHIQKRKLACRILYFTDLIQWAGWTATPETTCTTSSYDYPIFIKQKLAEKRRLQKEWHLHRTPTRNKLFNRATQELKLLLHDHKNYNIQMFLNGLTPTASTDYSLWKTT
jgi:hypothetical protein